ncbi:helix-turn-helix domain-containing protein [Shewanella algae]|jgi:DNA-binding NarL/FixJ family response regulator|uniref:helix-turn-helix domain-containing protein n=1 Tax=Shewanella algae TaxID=38313 RepID=UPI001182AB4A|nr:helix-turn-helix transcriptional regulator [Shewanella algae]MBO2558935.1 helix-turn-helix transcriptional regulator [Shewanella algae]MBO2575912.1 helix-turn-helix transcriptional regulator [Shewanella algae]TVO83404.1 hypothetical protein AYI80_19505 [Shewanella algae]TXS82009.1 hypothetical protein AYI81_21155 [Shewanella algae]
MPNINHLVKKFKQQPPESIFVVVRELFPSLSDREAEALYWLATGLHTSDIAKVMNVKESTIKTFISRCQIKLKAESNLELRLQYHAKFQSFHTLLMLNI